MKTSLGDGPERLGDWGSKRRRFLRQLGGAAAASGASSLWATLPARTSWAGPSPSGELESLYASMRDRLALWEDTPEDWRALAAALNIAGDPRSGTVRLFNALLSGDLSGPQAVEALRDHKKRAQAAHRPPSHNLERFSQDDVLYSHGFAVRYYPLASERGFAKFASGRSIMDFLRSTLTHQSELLSQVDLSLMSPDDGHLAEVAKAPEFRTVRALTVSPRRVTDAGVRALCESPHLNPRLLSLSGSMYGRHLSPETLGAIGKVPWDLRSLNLSGHREHADATAQALAATGSRIRALSLYPLRFESVATLIRQLPGLESLDLSFGDDPGKPVLEKGKFQSKIALYLHNSEAKHIPALAGQPWLRSVKKLHANAQSPVDAQALVSSPHLSGLTELNLKSTLSNPGLAALLSNALNLDSLMLWFSGFGGKGGRILAQHKTVAQLERLRFIACGFGPEGLTELGKSPHSFAKVDRLKVWRDTGHGGLDALAERDDLRPTRLGLGRMELTDEDARRLARSKILSRVRVLDLSDNQIGPKGLAALIASPHLTALQHVNLEGNPLGDEGLKRLADPSSWPTLVSLLVKTTGDQYKIPVYDRVVNLDIPSPNVW